MIVAAGSGATKHFSSHHRLLSAASWSLYSTCHEATAEQVIRWYAMRWSVEVTFRDSKQCLSFEEPQVVTGGGAHAPGAGVCRQAKQGLRSAVCIRV